VKITFGLQGKNFFNTFREVWQKCLEDAFCMMGYVPLRHVPLYAKVLRNIALVEVLWTGFPYGKDYGEKAWICTRKIGDDGIVIGPKTIWDK